MMRRVLLMCWCAVMAWSASAQQRNVTGKVTDAEDGTGLPGVSILKKGTTQGTLSDASGNYTLEITSEDVLTFSFIGYEPQEIVVGEKTFIEISLKANINQLSEVVVIGFGEREKKDLTGAISTVKDKDISSIPFASPQFALQGKASGVRIVNGSGNPSEGPQIFVRGIGTWNGSSQPLYVIDGQIITTPSAGNQDLIGSINLWTLVNPQDIEAISVLKDASASAIYGSRAANGVILITTKKGKKGKPVVEFNSQFGIQNVPTADVLNTQDMITLSREIYTNSANPNINLENNFYGRSEADLIARRNQFTPQLDPTSPFYIGENPGNYNWQDAVRNKNAVNQNYNIKVSGASDAANYYISFGYTDQESVIIGNDLKRYNLALNVNTDVGKFIKTGINYKITQQEAQTNSPMQLLEAASSPPYQPLYDPTNFFGYAPSSTLYNSSGVWEPFKNYGNQTRSNPLARNDVNSSKYNLLRNIGQAFLEIEPIKGLKVRGSLNLDFTYQQREEFEDILSRQFGTTPSDPFALDQDGNSEFPANSFGSYGLRTNKFLNYQADLTTSYVRDFGKHNINALVSIQDQYYKNWNEDLSTRDLSSRQPERWSVPNTDPRFRGGFSGRSEKFWYSYVGRVSYNYDSKYYVDLSARRDASNGFPVDSRWGVFPSFSLAWRLTSEKFMQNIPLLNDLKLRGGWGQLGNDELVSGQFAYLSQVGSAGSYAFGSGNGNAIGNYTIANNIVGFPNTGLQWETVDQTNIGFDAVLLDNKLNVTFEYYNRITNDILQNVRLPLIVGTNDPIQNIGKARNRGIELEVGYNSNIGDFTYGISGNISFVNNKVLELYDGVPLFTGFGRVEEGRSIGHIWGYKLGGIFQTQQEIDAYYLANPDETIGGNKDFVRPGDMYFLDVQGDPTEEEPFYSKTPDQQINNYDETEIGNTIPGHTYGVNLTAGYKGLDLTLNFYGEGNVDRVNGYRQSLENMGSGGLNYSVSTLNRWTPENQSTTMPRAVAGDPAGNNRFSSRYVEKANFFRLNTWQLGYSLPKALLGKTNGAISRFRVFVGGQNNILITNWSGLDPVNDAYPLPRSFFVGLNASF
jgi:TonB-dependent starch-binding outer membrane protein SusC